MESEKELSRELVECVCCGGNRALCHQSLPISRLDDFLNWQPDDDLAAQLNEKCRYVELANHYSISKAEKKSKVLVCHDFKGGYGDDKFNHGTSNADAYRFFHWSQIDTFIYFSHHLITIPPRTWINAAHTNGVPILGTLIIEGWTQTNEAAERLFASDQSAFETASKLANIANFDGFEGWFINIEAYIGSDHVRHLLSFLKYLTDLMHKESESSLVIWYDSVTWPVGQVRWQNELNGANKPFFEACDGIFLNYNWTDKGLATSREVARQLERQHDVYVGVDIFGRGCPGGGGWNTKFAVDKIGEAQLSVAIFAPGWTHECLDKKNFLQNECAFWWKLGLPVQHCPQSLPLSSGFCQGFGQRFYRDGQVIANEPWHNLSLQHLQPSYRNGLEHHAEEAFNGGGCILLTKPEVTIFRCRIQLPPFALLSITWKNLSREDKIIAPLVPVLKFNISKNSNTADLVDIDEIKESKEFLIGPKMDLTTTHPNNWISSLYLIKTKANKEVILESIGAKITCESIPKLLIGELKVCEILINEPVRSKL